MQDVINNQDSIKGINQKKILGIIMQNGSESIKEIANRCDLSIQSVSKNIEYLVNRGLLRKVGIVDTTKGRKPSVYTMDYNYRHILAIDLSGGAMRIGVGALDGQLAAFREWENVPDKNIFLNILFDRIDYLLQEQDLPLEKIHSIVVANPGVVDKQTGTIILHSKTTTWHDIPLKTALESQYGIPALVENDMNLAALGEIKCNTGNGFVNGVYLRLDTGSGAGIVIDEKIIEGAHGGAGAIGSMILSNRGGRIDNYLNVNVLLQNIKDNLSKNSPLLQYVDGDPDQITLKLIAAHHREDTTLCPILDKFIDDLSLLVHNICSVVDPPIVIIGGKVADLGPDFLLALDKYLKEWTNFPPQVVYSPLGEKGALLGAVARGIDHFLSNYEVN